MSLTSDDLFLLFLPVVIPLLAFLCRAARRHGIGGPPITRVSRFFSRLRTWASSFICQAPTPHDRPPRTDMSDEGERWKELLKESEETIEKYLSLSTVQIDLATFIRCVTFRVFLKVFLGVDLDLGDPAMFERLKGITGALAEFYDDSQGMRRLPSDVNDTLKRLLPPSYLVLILPAYEALWRTIATIVVTCEDDETRARRGVMLDFRDNPRDRQYKASFDNASAAVITDDAGRRLTPIIARPQSQVTESDWPLSCIQNATWSDWTGASPPTVWEAKKFAALVASMVVGRIGVHYGMSGPVDGGVGSQGSLWNQRRIFKHNHQTTNVGERIPHTGTTRQAH